MAGILFRFYYLVLVFCVCFSKASPDRRFSDFKRCADDECSMLLCRGKAAKDFSGPDCRFLSFKKGETIYVYYKLSGQRSDVWAGSVGSNFGYFPKDFFDLNHIYTEKEIEVAAEETDFVCFDTGLDTFESYDIDLLLRDSLLLNESDSQSEKPQGTVEKDDAVIAAEDVKASEDKSPKDTNVGDIQNSDLLPKENKAEQEDDTVEASFFEPTQTPLESTASDVTDKEINVVGATSESNLKSADYAKDTADEPLSEDDHAIRKSEHITEVEALPELKTTLGTTFDAVTSDDEDTRRVTPYLEEDECDTSVDQASEQVEKRQDEPLLLPAAEEPPYFKDNIHDSHESNHEDDISPEYPVEHQEEVTETTKDGMWSNLGDTVFKIVSGGERTISPEDTENKDDEEEEEEEGEEEDTDKDSEDLLHAPDLETNTDADETKNSEDTISPNSIAEADELEESNNDPKTEGLILSNDTKRGETVHSDDDTTTENPVSSKGIKTDEKMYSDAGTIAENPTAKDTRASETQHSNTKSITEEPISQNDIVDTTVPEKDSKTLKHENQVDAESIENPELSKKSELHENFNDTVAETKPDTPKIILQEEQLVEKVAEKKTIQKETTPEILQFDKSEGLSMDSTFQLDDKKQEETDEVEDGGHITEDTLNVVPDKPKDQVESKQINRAKDDIVSLLESTLKAEQDKAEEEPEVYEDPEELLEDENALFSTEAKEKEEFIENDQLALAIPDEPKENSFTQTNDNTKSETAPSSDTGNRDGADKTEQDLTSIDSSVSLSNKPSDTEAGDGDAADKTQQGLTSLDFLVSPKLSDDQSGDADGGDVDKTSLVSPNDKLGHQSGDGGGADKTQKDLTFLDSSVSPSDEVSDTQTGDGDSDGDGPDKTQEDLTSLDSLVLPSDELGVGGGDGDSAGRTQEDPTSLDSSASHSDKVIDTLSGDEDTDSDDGGTEDTQQDSMPSDSSLSSNDKLNDPQSGDVDGDGVDETQQDPVTSKEPEYSDSVLRLTLLRDHFNDDEMERIQKYIHLKDLYRVEAMFTELEQELKSARESNSETSDDIESTLESILEVSENAILDEIEKILDAREQKNLGQQTDPVMFDEEAAILDDFQEFAFHLRQKYSAVSDSVPLVEESQSDFETADVPDNLNASDEVDDSFKTIAVTKEAEAPEVHEEAEVPEVESSSINIENDESNSHDMELKEDGGHFNKNKDVQSSFKDAEEVPRGPQAILENPLDIPFGFEMDRASASLESSEFYDHVRGWLVIGSELLAVYAKMLIAALPEEWQPGPTFHGLPWKPVVATAAVGILTILMFIWRSVLAVKSRIYQLTEKQLGERIKQLDSEKSDVLLKITELNDKIKQYEEKLKDSNVSRSSTQQKYEELKTRYQDLLTQKEELSVNISQLVKKVADTQEEDKTLKEKVIVMHQRIKKQQNSLKQYEEEQSKVQVFLDEAKLREDALKAQVLSLEKDNSALKKQKKSLLRDAKDWQEKHEKLGEEIKVYHKAQKDLEDSLVHKENEIDVLSCCIAKLKGLEVHEGEELLASGESGDKKGDPIKLCLKQMMDVSRITATLSVIEDERNRYMENFLAEQKARQALEEQFQKVMHDQTNLKKDKTHLESQYKSLQQRLQITTELYEQKENALQQKLTQEELQRCEKETKLSEVDGKALQAEEELASLRQKVKDLQEEMQQNERALKAEIAVQEKKAHENWLKARTSERALIEQKRESANLRQKIVECTDKMSDLEHALYKSGPPDRKMLPIRRGDSFGPSPVSGGAPSPPLMIEGPGHPPALVGRRNEPFAPRPPSDPHGRFSDLGHPLPSRPEFAPRTSSPCTQDGSFQLSKSQNQGTFLPSPIRDSPGPTLNAPPKMYGPPLMGAPLPPPSNGPLPSMIRPPNGHPLTIPPGPLGPDPRLKLPHMDSYGPPPLRPFGSVPPPYVRGPPLRDLPPMGPPPAPYNAHDIPPDFPGPHSMPFPPRPFRPGPLPPSGAMFPPPVGPRDFRGPTQPLVQSSRDGEMTQAAGHDTDVPPPQDTATTAVAEP